MQKIFVVCTYVIVPQSILQYLFTDMQSKNELGPRPIHWACVNGHIAVVDILLQAGVPIDTVDNKVRDGQL